MLSDELHTKVAIGNARLGLFNRVVIDDALVFDQQGDTLLAAARLSAKMDVWRILQGQVRIANIQLFGYDARLRRRSPGEPYNFQFIIDRFASEDTTATSLDLAISSIVVRRGSVSHDLDYEPRSDHFTPAHFRLDRLSIRASIDALTDDSLSLTIKTLSFNEVFSGLDVNDLTARLEATREHLRLTDCALVLPRSELRIPMVTADGPLDDLSALSASLQATGHITPGDLSCFLVPLRAFNRPLQFHATLTKDERRLSLDKCELTADGLAMDALADGHLNFEDTTLALPFDDLCLHLQQLAVRSDFYQPILHTISEVMPKSLKPELADRLVNLGDVTVTGELSGHVKSRHAIADVQVQTGIGYAQVNGQLADGNQFEVHASTEDIKLASLFADNESFPVNDITLTADVQGSINPLMANGSLTMTNALIKNIKINHINTDFALSPDKLQADALVDDDDYAFHFSANLHGLQGLNFSTATLDYLEGQVALENLRIRSAEYNYDLHQLRLTTQNDEEGHHLDLRGDFINAQADGDFRYAALVPTVKEYLSRILPSLILAPNSTLTASDDQIDFALHVWNVNPIFQLFNLDIQLPEAGHVKGLIDEHSEAMTLKVDIPRIIYGSEDLRDVHIVANQSVDSLMTDISLERMMEEGPVAMSVSAQGAHDLLKSIIAWDNKNTPVQRGEFTAAARFFRDEQEKLGAEINVEQGEIVLSDTVWNVKASKLLLHNEVVHVHGFEVSQLGRHLRVNGRVSRNESDTLYADLRGINLHYVFGMIDFHDVEMAGPATGKVKIHDIFTDIAVDADLRVDQFKLNEALLGTVYVTGGFGRKDDRAIDIDAYVHEPDRHEISHVVGLIKPGHEEGRGMTLDIQARYLNTYFINSFTEDIFTDLQGRATGHAYLHGPFKKLDLEGQLVVDTLATDIDVLGTHYHLLGGDSVQLFPGGIRFSNVKVYDRHYQPGSNEHYADLEGVLRFEHFKNMRFNFDINAHNLLGYDFRDFGNESFYGTVFADGLVKLSGQPGTLNVDIQCRPTAGTVFTYNVSTPETMTDNEFITFRSTSEPSRKGGESWRVDSLMQARGPSSLTGEEGDGASDEPNDIYINFDLDLSPDAQVRLLMNPRSEDYITLFGNGHIRANFHNKGRFQMYGTYHVDRGTYKLTLQDVIRKDFHFKPGGTIVFGGQPMKAALDLQAVYTVPSVSLNDLAAGSNFSNASVRVNCLMNLGGQAENPQISFDFDIPNVNEDEKQMVRSLISTDEERNLQIIYLLGIGRFYTYGLGADQSQANAAVQSLLSSTLSGQLNNLLSTIVGNSNWNIGTNLSTGTQGWQNVDVEGSLSGRLLNNRLLINGTFGYRDTPIANTNFIGDFDVQWLLNPSGNLRLKAYSETNDRYFTKTALTTQGIGIQVKKDFSTLRELFTLRGRKK